ncbi:hypothetical protein JCM9140_3105 [Halalkalibacter wakoensis JCM 9140]|uniref:Uncharacterized protein n=1 Tax=Halalkalibacter wakoensis JCM 9140 TaxID=1236970 RepID=W4Q4X8_9BACI|nr:hypothetical protein [Halalkalibacter wakoensis]GAE26995.1 hypothetical protein JCM9140_3105 [Halalkalibacter wakoensis JCM 9140]
MNIRKQLALSEIKTRVLEAAYFLSDPDSDYSNEQISEMLLNINNLLDEELQIDCEEKG